MTIDLDPAALREVTTSLGTAADTFDRTGQDAPASPDAGLAAPLLAAVLEGLGTAAARVVGSATTLARTAEACNVDLTTTDSEIAEQYLLDAAAEG